MGSKSLEFRRFKELSGRFRAGHTSCGRFYDECLALTADDGGKSFMCFFPELLVLLPDIDKQQVQYKADLLIVN